MSSSFGRIGAIARTTFIELARLRVFYVLVLFALVLIISSSFIARISFQQELQVTRDIALGAINFFLSMLAIVATAQLLPRDLEDRVIYSVLAKPVRRFEYMMGKFFGVLGLLTISLIAMSVLCLAVIHLREGSAVRETMQQMTQSPPEELERALTELHQAGVNQDLVFALLLTLTKAAVLASAHALYFQFCHFKHLYHQCHGDVLSGRSSRSRRARLLAASTLCRLVDPRFSRTRNHLFSGSASLQP